MILCFGDVHLSPHNEFSKPTPEGLTTLLENQALSLNWVSDQVRELKPELVVFLGDLHHTVGVIDVRSLNVAYNGFNNILETCKEQGSDFKCLVGNHDLTGDWTSLPHLNQMDVIRGHKFEHDNVFASYDADVEWLKDQLEIVAHPTRTLLFTHCPLKGIHISGPVFEKHGLDLENIRCRVISGHYHTPGEFPLGSTTVYRPGSLIARTFSDYPSPYGFKRGLIKIEDSEISWIHNPFSEEYVTVRGSGDEIVEKLKNQPHPGMTRLRIYVSDDTEINTEGFASSTIHKVPEIEEETKIVLDSPLDLVDEYVRRYASDSEVLQYSDEEFLKDIGRRLILSNESDEKLNRDFSILSLKIKNFMSIEDFSMDFSSEGLMLVVGENGSGKSSIFESIIWCLYGNTPRGTSADGIARQGSDGTSVCLELLVGETHASIERYRNHKEFGNSIRIFVDGEAIADSVQKVLQSTIDSLIGVNYWSFTSLIVLSGAFTGYFTSSTESSKREILNKVLGIDLYEKCKWDSKELFQQYNRDSFEIRTEIEKVLSRLSVLENVKKTRDSRIQEVTEECNANIAEYEKLNDQSLEQLATIETQQDQYEEHLGLLESKHANILNLLETEDVDFQDLMSKSSRADFKTNSLLKSLDDFKRQGPICSTCFQSIDEDHAIKEEKRLNNEIDSSRKDSEFYRDSLQRKKEIVTSAKETLKLVSQEISSFNKDINDLNAEIARLTSYIAVNKEAISHKKNTIESIAKNYNFDEVELNNLYAEKERLTSKESEILAIEQAYSFWVDGFGNKGIMNLAIPSILKKFEGQIIKYLQEFFGEKIIVSVGFENEKIKIIANGNSYENLSSGERSRVDLAVQFSLYDLLSGILGSCNLLIVDEIDKGLDEQGVSSLVELLRSLSRQVFLVSHNPAVRGLVNEGLISVTKNGGVTNVEFL